MEWVSMSHLEDHFGLGTDREWKKTEFPKGYYIWIWEQDWEVDQEINGKMRWEGWQEKVRNIEEWKKLLRTARNRWILHMTKEWNECHILSRQHFGRRVPYDYKSYGPWYYLVCWWATPQNCAPNNSVTTEKTWIFTNTAVKRLWWSRGSVLPLSTQVRGFKPSRSQQDFSGRKNPQHAFLWKGSKAVGPMSQICNT